MTDLNLRDKLAKVIDDNYEVANNFEVTNCPEIADAILDALPGMVKPLDFERLSEYSFRANGPMFGSIRVESYGDFWHVNWSAPGITDSLIEAKFPTPTLAIEAAQYLNVSQIMAALGIGE